jgi:hypothetical protein
MNNSRERADLLGLVVAMPEEQVREVLAVTREILAKAKIDVSYEWSEQDLEDLRRDSADRANRAVPWDDEVPDPDGANPR